MKTSVPCLALLFLITFFRTAYGDSPGGTSLDGEGFAKICKEGAVVADSATESGKAFATSGPLHAETYSSNPLLATLSPGWYRLTMRVRTDAPVAGTDGLDVAFWNPINHPNSWRYQSHFLPQEFPPPGTYGDLTRTLHVGESGGSIGFGLKGGCNGLRIASVSLAPIDLKLQLQGARPDKLLYGLKDAGHVTVSVINATSDPQPAHLTVKIESGLTQAATIYDADITIPARGATGEAQTVDVPMSSQSEYGHAVNASLSQNGQVVGTARDYFYVSDRPVQIGQLGGMSVGNSHYDTDGVPEFIEAMRRHYFPMYEIDFWAPDDVVQLVPDKDKWWSGQTLARLSKDALHQRIDLGHAQGMKVLGYANLRYDYGFRIAEFFRKQPEMCEWDANDSDLAFAVSDIARQVREDDSERFDPDKPNKPKFNGAGIWGMMTGNPALVDFHLDQITQATKEFGWDGFRYDDRYDYDYKGVDMLGRQMPFPGSSNPTILAHIRAAYEQARPGLIYGHNMEWRQGIDPVEEPMAVDAPPYPGDYYTEFLRDGGLHLQERFTAHMKDWHWPWKKIAEDLFRVGFNARRFGGQAYNISSISGARPVDSRYLTAFNLAGMSHIAYDVEDEDIGYMRLACRFVDLFYGDHLVPLLEPDNVLKVDAGAREIWWKRYVRYREIEPGHRLYLVHLINPPRAEKVSEGDPNPPDAISNIHLEWTLPSGWKATKAYHLAGEGGVTTESSIKNSGWLTTTDIVGNDIVQQELPLEAQGTTTRVTLPTLRIWSMVVLDCTGPTTDVAPDAMAKLPPVPEQPPLHDPPMAENPPSPNDSPTWILDAENTSWHAPSDSKQPAPTVADSGATSGHALQAPVALESYFHSVNGGTYRFSVRVKSVTPPPSDAALNYTAWPNGRKWTVTQSFSLSDLSPDKGWQTLTQDVEMGNDNGNFGLQVTGGFDGLLVDNFKMEQIGRYPDSKQLANQNLSSWPADQGLVAHDGVRIWDGEGLYYEHFHLEEALRGIPGVHLDESSLYVYRDKRGFNGPQWNTPADLAAYDLVVINDIDLKTFSLPQRDWLRGYVQAGGALLLTGGPYGLGRGFWQESDLLDPILPAQLHAYDLRPSGIKAPLEITTVPGGYLGAFASNPQTLWLHEVKAKDGATVQLKAGDNPVLITWQAGKGRVAVLALAPLGEDNDKVWWKSSEWPGVMEKTVHWLLAK